MDLARLRAARKLLILPAVMARGPLVASFAFAFALAFALAALASGGGCVTARDAGAEAPDDFGAVCVADGDCALAGESCCACPTIAVPIGDGFNGACDGVDCPTTPPSCAPLVARCDRGACVAECAPAPCPLVCEGGFAADASGCLACACAGPAGAECAVDGDCVRAPADCCGCERGGNDTAVPASRLGEHEAGLMCTGLEACPEVSTCSAGLEPRCQVGRCVLAAPTTDPGVPAGACGRPELPPCPQGELCVINDSDAAGPLGIGVCRPPP